ncbi:MAG: sigma-54 dependent transcriptional regulator [Chlamydiota bacterium]|nr:sigma-54 dependent transcriptional regulator [Chlamydiota bacterium]
MTQHQLQNILVIEDDEGIRCSIELALHHLYNLYFCDSAEAALERVAHDQKVDLITLDIMLPGMSGLDALPTITGLRPDIPVIVLSAVSDAPTGVKAIKLGAYDYIVKPFMGDELRQTIAHALENATLKKQNAFMQKEVSLKYHPDQLIGKSNAIQQCREKILLASQVLTHVLITGETGTGKELVARAIHYNSTHRTGPFIAVNCASLPKGLVESELFGHEKGAFTGALQKRIGAFEQSEGGTLFLDEIADLDSSAQAKLLRVLEDKQIQRVGGTSSIKLDIRLICATNKDLTDKSFRRDLYYRIHVFHIHLPPLRERSEDIPLLIEHWLAILQSKMGLERKKHFTLEQMKLLQQKTWPGNVRELKNYLEALLISQRRKTSADTFSLPQFEPDSLHVHSNAPLRPFKETMQCFEKELLESALQHAKGNITDACSLLDVTPRILRYRMKQLGMLKKNYA